MEVSQGTDDVQRSLGSILRPGRPTDGRAKAPLFQPRADQERGHHAGLGGSFGHFCYLFGCLTVLGVHIIVTAPRLGKGTNDTVLASND